jgi:hypothetical protein
VACWLGLDFITQKRRIVGGDKVRPVQADLDISAMVGGIVGMWLISGALFTFIYSFPLLSLFIFGLLFVIVSAIFIIAINFAPENNISRRWDKFVAEKKAKKFKAEKVVDITP